MEQLVMGRLFLTLPVDSGEHSRYKIGSYRVAHLLIKE